MGGGDGGVIGACCFSTFFFFAKESRRKNRAGLCPPGVAVVVGSEHTRVEPTVGCTLEDNTMSNDIIVKRSIFLLGGLLRRA